MIKLGVVLTFDMSISKWRRFGVLEREMALYRRLSSAGVDVTFITYGNNDEDEALPEYPDLNVVSIYSIVKRPSKKVYRFLQSFLVPFYLSKHLRYVDVVKSNQMFGSWIAVFLAKNVSAHSVVRCGFEKYLNVARTRPLLVKKFAYWLMSYALYNLSDRVILTTDSMKKFVSNEFKTPKEKISVIPNYVDIEEYRPVANTKKNGKMVFVGRISYAKNIPLLINSAKASGYELDVIGDGEDMLEMENYAKKINANVNFIGRLNGKEVSELLPYYDVFISTSRYEGHPKALIEAMSCGLPCICTNVPGNNDVVVDGINGFLCKEDVVSVSKKIKELMANNSLRSKVGSSARKCAIKNYSLENIAANEAKIYSLLLDDLGSSIE